MIRGCSLHRPYPLLKDVSGAKGTGTSKRSVHLPIQSMNILGRLTSLKAARYLEVETFVLTAERIIKLLLLVAQFSGSNLMSCVNDIFLKCQMR